MNLYNRMIAGIILIAAVSLASGEVKIDAEHLATSTDFKFKSIPHPAVNDAASSAVFSLVEGERDSNGGALTVLQDGRLPAEEDQPARNFFFRAGSKGGRIQIDLGSVISVKAVNTYSWHGAARGPQVYSLYGAEKTGEALQKGTDPVTSGWKLIGKVDTRPKTGAGGGQHGVSVRDKAGEILGQFRFLLFDMASTQES